MERNAARIISASPVLEGAGDPIATEAEVELDYGPALHCEDTPADGLEIRTCRWSMPEGHLEAHFVEERHRPNRPAPAGNDLVDLVDPRTLLQAPQGLVDEGAEDAVRKIADRAVDLAPQAVPDRAHLLVAVLDADEDDRHAGLGDRGHEIQLGDLLDGLLELVGDELLHPLGAGPGEVRGHEGHADHEARVLGAGQVGEGLEPHEQQHHDQGPGDHPPLEGEARQVQG